MVNGFTGSSIWHLVYSFPPNLPGQIDRGYEDFANRFGPIMDVFQKHGVKFALEVHPTEIAFDIVSAERAIDAVGNHPAFGFNYDPSHFGYQGVDYVEFLYRFADRIFHVHMKDVAWSEKPCEVGVFGGHVDFHNRKRFWDFKSMGRGNINFEKIIRALNDIGYNGPLSVEWEDGGMDREFGAAESAKYVKNARFPVQRDRLRRPVRQGKADLKIWRGSFFPSAKIQKRCRDVQHVPASFSLIKTTHQHLFQRSIARNNKCFGDSPSEFPLQVFVITLKRFDPFLNRHHFLQQG